MAVHLSYLVSYVHVTASIKQQFHHVQAIVSASHYQCRLLTLTTTTYGEPFTKMYCTMMSNSLSNGTYFADPLIDSIPVLKQQLHFLSGPEDSRSDKGLLRMAYPCLRKTERTNINKTNLIRNSPSSFRLPCYSSPIFLARNCMYQLQLYFPTKANRK